MSEALVIEDLAGDLLDRECDVVVYGEMLSVALTVIRDGMAERDRLREQLARLKDEYRALREALLREEAA